MPHNTMQTLYVRSHLARKPQYQVLTKIVRDVSAVTVTKSPVTPLAWPHLLQTKKNESAIAEEYGAFFQVLRGVEDGHSLVYPFLSEPSLHLQMERALIKKDFSRLHQLFHSGLDLIRSLPTVTLTTHPEVKKYRQWFGSAPDLQQPMMSIGMIDFTAGNIIATQPLPTLLDCEWVVPFPVERELIEFRYLWHLVGHFSSLCKMSAKQLDLFVVGNHDFVVPQAWMKAVFGKIDSEQLSKHLHREQSIQSHILDIQKHVVPLNGELFRYGGAGSAQQVYVERAVAEMGERSASTAAFLQQQQMQSAHISNETLREIIARQEVEISQLGQQLHDVHHSKWWQLLYLIHNPKKFFLPHLQWMRMMKIRILSKLRRKVGVSLTESMFYPETDLSTLNLQRIPMTTSALSARISIIIPVFNAGVEVRRCVESVLTHSPSKDVYVYLIDDLSTDPELKVLYNELKKYDNVTVSYNKRRQGFVKNINKGLQLAGSDDVIILNTDTEVTRHWVKKLHAAAYARPQVATVTPMTNNGEIVSLPRFVQPNVLPTTYSLAELNIFAERFSAHQHIRVPTGVGFCMYIRREAIDAVGVFDDKTFGMGYGEENDFCQRAIRAGFSNIIDDATFIYHRGTSSFTSAEKKVSIEKNLQKISALYPTYHTEVHNFIARNPLKYMQELFSLAIEKPEYFSEPAVLFIMHKDPFAVVGGVEVDAKRMLQSIGPSPLFFVLHRDDNARENRLYIKIVKNGVIVHQFIYTFTQPITFIDLEHKEITHFWMWMLKAFPNITTVHLEHTYALPLAGLKCFAAAGRKVLLNFHDFYYVCPYEKLINDVVPEYLGLEENIDACYRSLSEVLGSAERAESYRKKRYALVTELLEHGVDQCIFNSQYTLDAHRKIWPQVFTKENSTVIEPYV